VAPAEQWRYTDDDGVQRLVDAAELRAALADGRLKPGTLVWRRGMKHWLPAASVSELSSASQMGGQRPATPGARIGLVAAPTPSIPPPARTGHTLGPRIGADSSGMPENMVNIDALRSRSERRRKETSPGFGAPDNPESVTMPRAGSASTGAGPEAGGPLPPPPRVPTMGGPSPSAADADRPKKRERRTTKIGGLWLNDEQRRDEETTTTMVRDEIAPPKAEAAEAPKPASADDGGKPRGLRMPAAPQVNRGLTPSVPPLARSLTPPASGGGAGTRPSKPPPPKHSRGGARPAEAASGGGSPAPSAVAPKAGESGGKGPRSIPPPAPQHRGRKGDEGRAAATPEPAAAQPSGAAAGEAAAGASPMLSARAIASRSGAEASAMVMGAATEPAATAGPKRPTLETQKLPNRPPPTAELPVQSEELTAPAPPMPILTAQAPLSPSAAAPEPTPQPAPRPAPEPAPAPIVPGVDAAPDARPTVRRLPELVGGDADASAQTTPGGLHPPWAPTGELGAETPAPSPPRDSWPRVPSPAGRSASLTVRLSALVGTAVVVGLLLASSFLVGRLTAPAQAGIANVVRARTGFATVPLFARTNASQPQGPRPCLMLRAPARWAEAASKSIPFEMLPTPNGKLAIGYAIGSKQVQGLIVDPDTGIIEEQYNPDPGKAELSRIVPLVEEEGKIRFAETRAEQAGVRNGVWVSEPKPFIVGFKDDAVVALEKPDAEPRVLWKLDPPGKPDALRAMPVGGKGVAIAYRNDNRSWFGWLGADGSVGIAGAQVGNASVESGKPMIAQNGETVSLVYTDRASKEEPAAIRWAKAPAGSALAEPTTVELPPGGPGGDAIAPAVAGLSGGRWVLMWTEGPKGAQKVLRAQTYGRDGQRIGEALQVSPATGSFGQGTVGVKGESAAVVFLLRRDGFPVRFELWGTVLQCQ
jgi:hypothetical protein